MNRFIALDPSSIYTGWAVFEGESLVAWGVINTGKVFYSFRFQFIINELIYLVQTYGVQEIAIEDVKYAWQAKTRQRNISAMQVVFVSINEWAKSVNLPLTAHNPATWKNGTVGDFRAPKIVTKNNIRLRFPKVPDNLTEHEYDAIGIGVYHAALQRTKTLEKVR